MTREDRTREDVVAEPRLEEARRSFLEARSAMERARERLLRTHAETARGSSTWELGPSGRRR